MKIIPDQNKIRSFTKHYWQIGRKVLFANSRQVVDMIGNVPLDEIKGRSAAILNSQQLRSYLIDIWSKTGSWFARDMSRRMMTRQKSDAWEEAYIHYMEARIGAKALEIARTEATLINDTIDMIVNEGFREGWSIDRISAKIRAELDKRLRVIHDWEAERIARTEVIGAANKGSYDGAVAGGTNIKKGWLTSGRSNVRDSHRLYESYGFKDMNFQYNIGLLHPGDPNGSPEEIINCACTIVYETQQL